jgi:putative redox protein
LGFDFTGLGESEGEFSETTFSSNIDDLTSAARFLEDNYSGPRLLLGHSLGGAAALVASGRIDSVRAVVTLSSPYSPDHMTGLLKSEFAQIRERGEAVVNIGGRDFKLKKQFLDDLESYAADNMIDKQDKPLLILHSPDDRVVSIENAEKIFAAASHPKSLVVLPGVDHLLSRQEDSQYAANLISAWAERYLQ